MTISILPLRLLGVVLLLVALSSCTTRGPASSNASTTVGAPAGGLPGYAPAPLVGGSTAGGDMPGSAGTIGVPPSSGSGSR